MPMVIIMDQIASSASPDRVKGASERLNRTFDEFLTLSFVRTAGDEMQAVLGDSEYLAPILQDTLDAGGWWVGVGIGTITRQGRSARASAGPAFNYAREAVDAAKHDRQVAGPVAVRGEVPRHARDLQAAVSALAFIIRRRTKRQREIVAAMEQIQSRRRVGEQFQVSHQTISKTLSAAGFEQVRQLSGLIGSLAYLAY